MPTSSALQRLETLLPDWWQKLQEWAGTGELTAAASQALQLTGLPTALVDLNSQLASGDMTGLPSIELLSGEAMAGAWGAYATSNGTIYLNADWLDSADAQAVIAVLTEELGHHLDALCNSSDTSGDEGAQMAALLLQLPTKVEPEDDWGVVTTDQGPVSVERATSSGTTPPVIKGLTIETPILDASQPGRALMTFTMTATLNSTSGNSFLSSALTFENTKGQNYHVIAGPISVDGSTYTFRGSAWVNPASSGLYELLGISISDNNGNELYANSDDPDWPQFLEQAGINNSSFTVLNNNPNLDVTPPSLKGFALSSTSFNLNDPGALISATVQLKDSQGGLGFAGALTNQNWYASFSNGSRDFTLGGGVNIGSTYSGTLKATYGKLNIWNNETFNFDEDPESSAGRYVLSSLALEDAAGNQFGRDSSQPEWSSFLSQSNITQTFIDVINGPSPDPAPKDTEAPVITALSLSQSTLDLSQQDYSIPYVTAGFRDNASGIKRIALLYSSTVGRGEFEFSSEVNYNEAFIDGSKQTGSMIVRLDSTTWSGPQSIRPGKYELVSVTARDDANNYFGANTASPDWPAFLASANVKDTSLTIINPNFIADNTAPNLTSLEFPSKVFDRGQSKGFMFQVKAGYQDDLSGLDYIGLDFQSPDGKSSTSWSSGTDNFFNADDYFFPGSTQLKGSTSLSFARSIDRGITGTYSLQRIFIKDHSGNGFSISKSDPGWQSYLNSRGITQTSYELIDSTLANPAQNQLTIETLTPSLPEGNAGLTPFTFKIKRSGDLSGRSFVEWKVSTQSSGQSGDGYDFRSGWSRTGDAVFASGESEKAITVDVNGDTETELDEVFSVELATPQGASLGIQKSASATILNDDGVLTTSVLTVSASPSSVAEDGPTNIIFTFFRTGATTNALTVNYTVSGSATLGADYTGIAASPSTKSISFAAGSATTTLIVDPTTDTTLEPEETITLRLEAGTGYILGSSSQASATITNDDILDETINSASGVALLIERPSNRFLIRSNNQRSFISRSGSQITNTTYPDWTPIAAIADAKGNALLWKNSRTGDLLSWSMTSQWAYSKDDLFTTLGSNASRDLERRFLLDLDNSGLIGPISASTASTLGILPSSFRYAVASNGAAPVAISRFGSSVTTATFPDWAPIAFASDAKGNALLWKNSQTGALLSWAMNAQWAYTADLVVDESRFLSPISSSSSSTLGILPSSLRYAVASNGTSPVAISRFGSSVTTATFPDWAPIASASDAKGNALLWKNSQTGALLSWAMNPQWAYTADLVVDESRFLLPISSSSSSTLGILPSSLRYAVASNGAAAVALSRSGSFLNSSSYTDWAAIAATADAKGNALLWKNSRTGDFLSWSMNDQWAYTADDLFAKPGSAAISSLERRYSTDLDNNGLIGPISSYNDVSLSLLASSKVYAISSILLNPVQATRNGSPLSPSSYTDWSAIAVASNLSGNRLLWKNSRTGDLLSWSMNSQWAYSADDLFAKPGSAAVKDLERRFSIDFDADGRVGTLAPVGPPGFCFLGTLPNSNAYAISKDGAAPITVTRNSAPLSSSSFTDWTAIAAGFDGLTNRLLWKNSRTGDLLSWSMTAQWAYSKDDVFARPGTPAISDLERRFTIDLDGDGRIASLNVYTFSVSSDQLLRDKILAAEPNANARDPFSAILTGSPSADRLFAPAGSNILISGHDLITGLALPAAAVDVLDCGNLSDRCTVLIASTTDQPFADDGDSGYTLVRNLDTTRDDLVLPASGFTSAARSLNFEGSTVTGLGIHIDSNTNGLYDSGDNLIALLAGVTASPRIIQI